MPRVPAWKRKAGAKKAYRKRRYYRKRADGGKATFMRNTLVPDRMIMKMSYKDNINLSASTGTVSIWNGRLNSIYDPDLAVSNGHQPLGYDQWSQFYNRYRVFKAIVTVTIVNNQNGGVQCGLLPYNPLTSGGSIPASQVDDAIFEQPHVVTKTVAGGGGINRVVLKKVVDIPRILGKSHAQYKSSQYTETNFGTNPVEECYGAIFVRSINDSASPACQAIFNITYFCELFERKRQYISYPDGKNPEAGANPSYNPSLDD